MAYTLIMGKFRVVGFQPDGDSIRFEPDNAALVNALPKKRSSINLQQGKSIQLRLECIDALETHYNSSGPRFTHQPINEARAARLRLLALIGFVDVTWTANEVEVKSVKQDGLPGYILTRTFDGTGTRPVAYAFAGGLPAGIPQAQNKNDGDSVFMTVRWLEHGLNLKMVEEGFAYPMYYTNAFKDLRDRFDVAVATAKAAAGANTIWPIDATMAGFDVPPDTNILDKHAVWPKLFRRIALYYKDQPYQVDLSGLVAFLEANRDDCFDLVAGNMTALHNFVQYDAATKKIKLTQSPQLMLFAE